MHSWLRTVDRYLMTGRQPFRRREDACIDLTGLLYLAAVLNDSR
jgi:hypothetical protein